MELLHISIEMYATFAKNVIDSNRPFDDFIVIRICLSARFLQKYF